MKRKVEKEEKISYSRKRQSLSQSLACVMQS